MARRTEQDVPGRSPWWRAFIVAPAAILPLLPSASCPVCLAAYAGVLSSFGLGFLFRDPVQRPLIILFLSISVASIGWATRQHRNIGPIAAVVLGSFAIVAGRILVSAPWLVYVGVPCVVVAAAWNLVLKGSSTRNGQRLGKVGSSGEREHKAHGCSRAR